MSDDLGAFLGIPPSEPPPPTAIVIPKARTPEAKALRKSTPEKFTYEIRIFDEETKKYLHGVISDRESKFVVLLVKTGNLQKAADEIGISLALARRFLRRPGVRLYISHLRRRAALAADLTLDKTAAIISRAVDGDPTVKDSQVSAAIAAAKLMTPAASKPGVNVTVNQQNNYNGVGTSPFANLDSKAMLDELKKNLLEMGHGDFE